ncbi:MAG: DUF1080 domain-containing protein [Bryobacteraceae bacterium]
MKLPLLLACTALLACAGTSIPLFDGKTLTGWEARPTFVADSKGDWKVENGALVCGGTVPSWIATTQTYANYKLTLEFRGVETVNSGVFLRSQKEGQPHVTGYELQIWDYQPAGFNTGSLVGSLKAAPARIKAQQWNRYEITANGDRFVIVLNGKKLLDGKDAKHAAGVIGFQCQKDQKIEFRKIRLQPIGEAK